MLPGYGHPALGVTAWAGVGLGGPRGPRADLQESFLFSYSYEKKLYINEYCELCSCFFLLMILICLLPSQFFQSYCIHGSMMQKFFVPRISFAL